MFNELIYTRCRQGIDITQKGRQISSDGYKVYSCSPLIMEEGAVDLPFLANTAQTKLPYTDPDFMNDAYLFYVPDSGKSFFMNFHPIPFDANAQGDYAHRPGNFVNHALIGDFSQTYPYKMFQDDGIWNAKTKGEAYYYENSPADAGLPVRGDIIEPPGQYKFDEIGAFIADGRQEALKKAVAFLIAQYKEEPEKRKFLVIKDDSSKNIELWTAAIECAFSPRIASVIPFATRMDKFANTNRYTVKNGVYQPQINLQDPNHKQRYRAMIVGVDERDKANAGASRPIANSPFVLLDGKQKQAMFEADISNSYYQFIVKFDKEHNKFCGEFLQTFDVLKPGAEIYELYGIFTALNEPSLPDTRTLADALDRLNKYRAANSGIFRDIYNRVNTDVSQLMQKDFLSALNIIDWLLTASEVIGDTGAKQRLTETVCKAFISIIFGKADNTAKRSYWTQIQRTGFKMDAVRAISDIEIIKANLSGFNEFTPADAVTLVTIYLDSFLLMGSLDQQDLGKVVKKGIGICCRNNDQNSLHEIISSLARIKSINSQEFLFMLVKGADKELGEFVIKYIIDRDAAIFASDNSLWSFCKKLNDAGLGHLAGLALMKRVNSLNKPSEIERFIENISGINFINAEALAKLFESVDSRMSVSEDNMPKLVVLLQTKKPQGVKCINSAHLFALNILSGSRRKQSMVEELKDLKNQGFPAITDKNYIDDLVEYSIKANLADEEQAFILDIMSQAPKEYFSVYGNKLAGAAAKHKDKWNALIKYALKSGNKQIENDIVQALVDSRQNKKSLLALSDLLKDDNSIRYFDGIADRVLDIVSSQNGKPNKKDERK